MSDPIDEINREQRDRALAMIAERNAKFLERYTLHASLVRLQGPVNISPDEAREIVKKFEAAWPEVLDLIRRKAKEIDHRVNIQYDP